MPRAILLFDMEEEIPARVRVNGCREGKLRLAHLELVAKFLVLFIRRVVGKITYYANIRIKALEITPKRCGLRLDWRRNLRLFRAYRLGFL